MALNRIQCIEKLSKMILNRYDKFLMGSDAGYHTM